MSIALQVWPRSNLLLSVSVFSLLNGHIQENESLINEDVPTRRLERNIYRLFSRAVRHSVILFLRGLMGYVTLREDRAKTGVADVRSVVD